MQSIDCLLDRVPTSTYNCMDFVREAWLHLTGEDIIQFLTHLQGPFKDRKANVSGVKAFKQIDKPTKLCFVMMQHPKSVPHIGIMLDRKVLHLGDRGAEYVPLVVAKRYFTKIRFYSR